VRVSHVTSGRLQGAMLLRPFDVAAAASVGKFSRRIFADPLSQNYFVTNCDK
jgi:hypothetical protein